MINTRRLLVTAMAVSIPVMGLFGMAQQAQAADPSICYTSQLLVHNHNAYTGDRTVYVPLVNGVLLSGKCPGSAFKPTDAVAIDCGPELSAVCNRL